MQIKKDIYQRDEEGREHGYWEWYWWYPDYGDQLLFKGNYIHGERDGYWEWYHDNGTVRGRGNYINNVRRGLWRYYNDDETLKCKRYHVK